MSQAELYGFSDASEEAYGSVVYLLARINGACHVSIVMAKTKVAPLKRQTIPHLELCGAYILARLIHHVRKVLGIPLNRVHAWCDSTIVLGWLNGNPRRFKPFVANRVSSIIDFVPASCWNHISGKENPADCASRGLSPSELIDHPLWWTGPAWLHLDPSEWPRQNSEIIKDDPLEQLEPCFHTTVSDPMPLIPINKYSSFTKLKRITAWVMQFITNSHRLPSKENTFVRLTGPLSVDELTCAEEYWIKLSQSNHFKMELIMIREGKPMPKGPLASLQPLVDSHGIPRVGGRLNNSNLHYRFIHPIILHGTNPITKLLTRSEHVRLLHAGPTLLYTTLSLRFHLVGGKKLIRSVTRSCITCRRLVTRPNPPTMGMLPTSRVTPGQVFDEVGIDFAGPVFTKYSHEWKPVIVKSYICVFVSLSVKAVHLELVSKLTTKAFIACLRRFISHRGKPQVIWSDNGTNFVGANRELFEIFNFLKQVVQEKVSDFCSSERIKWKFIPQCAPHFGGLWEAAVKSTKIHLRRTIGETKLTCEEYMTLLAQVEACLNSRPLIPLNTDCDGQIEALTPGHFLVGKPLEALPDPSISYKPVTVLRQWHLVQHILRQFWLRWSRKYLTTLRQLNKWHKPS